MGNGWSELDRAKSGWVMGGPSLRTGCLGYPWAQASYPVQDSAVQYSVHFYTASNYMAGFTKRILEVELYVLVPLFF